VELFSECDHSKDGNVNFKEFAMSMWNFLGRDQMDLASFAFDCFDNDDTGNLGAEEIKSMIKVVYGTKTAVGSTRTGGKTVDRTDEHFKTVMRVLDKSHDGIISREEFMSQHRYLQQVLQPVFTVQESLFNILGGEKFWKKYISIRHQKVMDPTVIALFRPTSKTSTRAGKPRPKANEGGAGNMKKGSHKVVPNE
jgi:Ca2+-binding EF-hand superfamily protein